MRLIPTTFLASLAIAAPYVSGLTCPEADANLAWTVSDIQVDSANLSVEVSDPVSETNYACHREIAVGSTLSIADPVNYYPCDRAPTTFKWDGSRLSLKEEIQCDDTKLAAKDNLTLSGTSDVLSLPIQIALIIVVPLDMITRITS